MCQMKCGEPWVEELPPGQDQDLTLLWRSLPTYLPRGQMPRIGLGYAIL